MSLIAPAPTRRTVVRGAAWSLPVLAAASAVPALAVSCELRPSQWFLKSRIVRTDPDYSNANFDATVTYDSTPPGEASIQHFTNAQADTLNWRIPLGFPHGAQDGAVMTIPFDPSWTPVSGSFSPYSLSLFKRFGAVHPDDFTRELPRLGVTVDSDSFTVVFHGTVEEGAAGGVIFQAKPKGGKEAVLRGDTFTCQATVDFTPGVCPGP